MSSSSQSGFVHLTKVFTTDFSINSEVIKASGAKAMNYDLQLPAWA